MSDPKLHAVLSPSGASRWLTCTPSARLEQSFPDSSGDAAREGTLAHTLSELILKRELQIITPKEYQKAYIALLESDLVDACSPEEALSVSVYEFFSMSMMEYCWQYVTFVLEKFSEAKAHTSDAQIFIERRLDLTSYMTEAFGTGDAAIVANSIADVIDLKYGKGVEVSATDNSQLKIYALGWLNEFGFMFDIKTIRLHIFQPRIDNFSSWEISVEELMRWAEEVLMPKAILAFAGMGEFVAGKHCGFCRAKTSCKALMDYNFELAKYEFADLTTLTDSDVSDILDRAELFVNWIGAVKNYALKEALAGKKWPGYKLVAGRSDRYFPDERKVVTLLKKDGFIEDQIYNKKLLGLGELEKLLGGKKPFNALLGELISKSTGKPTLKPESDNRVEFNSLASAEADFVDEDDFM